MNIQQRVGFIADEILHQLLKEHQLPFRYDLVYDRANPIRIRARFFYSDETPWAEVWVYPRQIEMYWPGPNRPFKLFSVTRLNDALNELVASFIP